MKKLILPLFFCIFSLFMASCATHSTANNWNGLVGQTGDPVNLVSTTKIGLNLFVMIPLFGKTNVNSMVDEATAEIAEKNGDYVRVIQGNTENFWYGYPPFTWILTPVIGKVTAEFRPKQQVDIPESQ